MADYASGIYRDEMLIVAVCEWMHWTFEDYFEQPLPFLALLHRKREIDFKKEQAKQKAAFRGV